MFEEPKRVILSPRERWEVLSLAVRQRNRLKEKIRLNKADEEEIEFWNGLYDKMLSMTDEEGITKNGRKLSNNRPKLK